MTEQTHAPAREEAIRTVRVELGSRSYDILIGRGLMTRAGTEIARALPGARLAIITDQTVAKAHLAALEAALGQAGISSVALQVPPGETSKRFAVYERLCDEVLAARLERGDCVLAFGGGVVGDLAGFVAASVRRGMRFVQMPTSLLAQVDSSVGGKTGINSRHGKNLIGAFHQPHLVIADTSLLDTLSEREFRAGYAEVAKYGLIDDADFFAWLELNHSEIFSGGPAREEAVATACRAKARVVADDEFEAGSRALLNLGHTFGHALESAVDYNGTRLVHGEGVAIGMRLAFDFSVRLGLCAEEDARRMEAHLKAVGLPTHMSEIPGQLPGAATLVDIIAQDKKVTGGALTFILTRGIGRAFVEKGVPPDKVLQFLDAELRSIHS